MRDRQGYKQTELGEIPEEWDVKFLGQISNTIVPMRDKPKKFNGKIPWIRIEDLNGKYISTSKSNRRVSEETIRLMNLKPYPIGTVLCSCSGNMGICAIVKSTLVSNQTFIGIVPHDELYTEYAYYLLSSLKSKLQRLGSGTTIPYISKNKFKKLKIPLPPLLEQRKIASVLSTVDEAIQQTNAVIAKTEMLKRGLMQRLLTRGPIIGLEEIATRFISGGTPSTSNPEYWNGNIPWMKSAWIERRFVGSGEKYISEEGLRNSAANIVPKDNILIATRVCIGNVAINRIDIAISQDLTGIVIEKSKAYPEYVYWALRNSENKVRQLVQGSTIKGILREDLKRIKIPLPSFSEQHKIASIISSVYDKLEKESQIRGQLERLKKGLMQILLTGKVRVD